MRIALLTFHRALNYGALLQAYALKTVLEKLGNSVSVIDYRNQVIEDAYYYQSFFERKGFKSKIKYIIQGSTEISKRNKFERFRNDKLSLSDKEFTKVNIHSINQLYDLFVVGSDQVWNYNAHGFDTTYFLDFVEDNSKKRSYAASIGLSTLSDSYMIEYKRLLNNYQIVSIREKQGKDLLNSCGISNVRVDVDPTLLLTSSEWKQVASDYSISENYIFAYYFELTPSLKLFVEKLAKATGCIVVYVGNAFKSPFDCSCLGLKDASPEEFVSAISNASYVVTNSFHGTALSIVFNRPFFVELLQSDSAVNSRLSNILQETFLEHRQLTCFKDINEACESSINWDEVNDIISSKRHDSVAYLMEYMK